MLVPTFQEVARFVSDSMSRLEGQACIGVISVPAPFGPPTAFLRTQPRNMSFFWDSPGGTAFAGSGAAATIRLSGDGRFGQFREQVDALWRNLRRFVHPDCKPTAPRVFGGMAFHAGGAQNELWAPFGDGCFTLPRWCHGRRTARAFLSLAVRGDVDCTRAGREQVLGELEVIFQALANADEQSALIESPRIEEPRATRIEQLELARWEHHIEKIRATIATGRFQKIVAARRCGVELPMPIDELEVVSRLVVQPLSTRFLFGREQVSFLGASPEILFDKRGSMIRTEALAGTARCPPGAEPEAYVSELLDSKKDLSEHAFVVDEIARILAPFCEDLRSSFRPKVHRIREILHLHTPFKGRLKHDVHAVSLLEALHPTPAVGGLPTAAAAEWIARHEGDARGWYTGPVGWVDATGDARFVVAIRCGLVGSERAHIFTGAGIVYESEARAEYEETSLKQLPLMRALGVSEARAARGQGAEPAPPSSRRAGAALSAVRVSENA